VNAPHARACGTMDSPRPRRTSLEAHMGSKDKGGKATKKEGKGLKEKRADKKAKRAASDAKQARGA
jgi:hypothetical protein